MLDDIERSLNQAIIKKDIDLCKETLNHGVKIFDPELGLKLSEDPEVQEIINFVHQMDLIGVDREISHLLLTKCGESLRSNLLDLGLDRPGIEKFLDQLKDSPYKRRWKGTPI